ncbi:MAG TPA: hypothetical protein DEQ47_16095 [Solibacterales bacterium]|nr:hypothetical protein [Bryobacterales bacterium]
MLISRRYFMGLISAGFVSGTLAAFRPEADGQRGAVPGQTLVDALIDSNTGSSVVVEAQRRTYTASATVMLFSVPLVSRSGVGSGYTLIEQATTPGGALVSIQFGAGSYPETAHGLNRLGLIHEVVLEPPGGAPRECAYYAFMTTSQETSLSQAKKAVENQGASVPYVAAQGRATGGVCAARVERMQLPSHYTWRNADTLLRRLRAQLAGWPVPSDGFRGEAATFLYAVRRAMLDPQQRTAANLFFNTKRFTLATEKERDPSTGHRLANRKLVAAAESVMRLKATLQDRSTGQKTLFQLWYEAGSGGPPLRFEYQPRGFLRLAFEVSKDAQAPPVTFALKRPDAAA